MTWLSLTAGAHSVRPVQHRVLISVPKKIVPLAVDRNRIKRLIREAVRCTGGSLGQPYKSIGFRVLRHIKGLKLKDVQDEIQRVSAGEAKFR